MLNMVDNMAIINIVSCSSWDGQSFFFLVSMSFLYEKFRFQKLSIEVSNKNQETKDFSVSLFILLFCFIEVHGSINSLSFVTHVHGVLWSHVL
jgi:hypothetical protein